MKKRLTTVVVAAVLLAACGGDDGSTSDQSTPSGPSGSDSPATQPEGSTSTPTSPGGATDDTAALPTTGDAVVDGAVQVCFDQATAAVDYLEANAATMTKAAMLQAVDGSLNSAGELCQAAADAADDAGLTGVYSALGELGFEVQAARLVLLGQVPGLETGVTPEATEVIEAQVAALRTALNEFQQALAG